MDKTVDKLCILAFRVDLSEDLCLLLRLGLMRVFS
ncbi:Uncharacterised protein [Vibrio cholerae]|nr:Uncharacterised protein [Vibrio cholerae]